MSSNIELVERLYDRFNAREMDAVLSIMHPDVVWANGLEGGFVYGRDGVRFNQSPATGTSLVSQSGERRRASLARRCPRSAPGSSRQRTLRSTLGHDQRRYVKSFCAK